MEKWHITITDNETGEKQVDIDTSAIIAGMDDNDGTRCVYMTHCNVLTHAATICVVQKMIEARKAENPILATLVACGATLDAATCEGAEATR